MPEIQPKILDKLCITSFNYCSIRDVSSHAEVCFLKGTRNARSFRITPARLNFSLIKAISWTAFSYLSEPELDADSLSHVITK